MYSFLKAFLVLIKDIWLFSLFTGSSPALVTSPTSFNLSLHAQH